MQKIPTIFLIAMLMLTSLSMNSSNESSYSITVDNPTTANISVKAEILADKVSYEGLDKNALRYGLLGYLSMKAQGKLKKDYLVIIDFSKSSNEKRLFIVKPEEGKVIHSSVVSHGRNSGNEFATSFSNKVGSNQSSLGFYLTDNTYIGKHGLSLRLNGLEEGFNSNARKRAVVIHSAKYANPSFARKVGRLGRSFGCPALPETGYDKVIQTIKEGALIFIYHPQQEYLENSPILKTIQG